MVGRIGHRLWVSTASNIAHDFTQAEISLAVTALTVFESRTPPLVNELLPGKFTQQDIHSAQVIQL